MGFLDAREVNGRFGSSTRLALTNLYEGAGFSAPVVGRQVFAPMSELWVTPDTNIEVRAMASIGEGLVRGEPIGTVSTPERFIVTRVQQREATEMSIGDSVTILDETTGETQEAEISSIAPSPDVNTDLVVVTIFVDAMFATDRDYRITIVLSQSDGAVLAVPQTAIYAGSGGALYVLRIVEGGSERVDVTMGIVGVDGFAEVTALPGGVLQVGDLVAIGPGQ